MATLIAVLMAQATYWMNCWPSDSCLSYVPTASRLFQLPYLAKMHDLPADSLGQMNMRGKEALILGIAVLQGLLKDKTSLFPNILLLILAIQVSSVLFYIIFRALFGRLAAWVIVILFMTCFWPYTYVLLGAHQPLVLANFLLSFFFLLGALRSQRLYGYFFSGLFFGLMMFSSPTSLVYIPYFLVPWIVPGEGGGSPAPKAQGVAQRARNGLFFILGMSVIIGLFTYPAPIQYLRDFALYVSTSQHANHFQHYHAELAPIVPSPSSFRGAGWTWIIRYFFLILPVLFPVYLISLAYLVTAFLRQRTALPLMLISLSTPWLVETSQVAQFGRNYFSWLFGIMLVVGYVIRNFQRHPDRTRCIRHTRWEYPLIAIFILAHILVNAQILFSDVLPSRLATTRISRWLKDHRVQEIFVYADHPRNPFLIDNLNHPLASEPIRFLAIKSLAQPKRGYILIPPQRGRTIWNNGMDRPFETDPRLVELYRSGAIDAFAAASFPTIASSRYWSQEEEICTYLDLVAGQIPDYDDPASRAYLLDAEKLAAYFTSSEGRGGK